VLTNLGRVGCPVIRYATGDVVRANVPAIGFTLLESGILGRADDMLIVRGVNIFPSSIESIIREFPQIAEFRMIACKQGAMDDLVVEIEDAAGKASQLRDALQVRLGLRVEVSTVPPGSLPRFEVKGKRFIDQRQ
jgi:phenylacetate-CoA ligase